MDYMTELAAIAKTHGGIIETKIAAQHGISKGRVRAQELDHGNWLSNDRERKSRSLLCGYI